MADQDNPKAAQASAFKKIQELRQELKAQIFGQQENNPFQLRSALQVSWSV